MLGRECRGHSPISFPFTFCAAPLSEAPVLPAPATASPRPVCHHIILQPRGSPGCVWDVGMGPGAVTVALCVWLGALWGGHCPITPSYGGTGI